MRCLFNCTAPREADSYLSKLWDLELTHQFGVFLSMYDWVISMGCWGC